MNEKLKEFIRFVVVGVIATIVLYGTYWQMLKWFSPTISYSFGYLLAFLINYFLTAAFTFRVKKTIENGVGFVVSNVINYFASIGLLKLFLYWGLSDKLAPLTTIFVTTISNFVIVRLIMKKL